MNEVKTLLWDACDESEEAKKLLMKGFSTGKFYPDSDYETYNADHLFAENGSAEAMYDIGVFCMEGLDGWPVDDDPIYWFKKASENGFKAADVRLAVFDYLKGDCVKARKVFEDSYDWNDLSKLCLGIMHWNGDAGFERSEEDAVECWESFIDTDPDDVIGSAPNWDSGELIDIEEMLNNVMVVTQYYE